MKIHISTIPHDSHRYPTVGDWYYDETGDLHIKVSKLGNWRQEMLIAVHELIEVLICKHNGVSQQAVDKFDKRFENNRKKGDESEPGDDPKAPYYHEHQIASVVERLLALELGVNWEEYAVKIESMP